MADALLSASLHFLFDRLASPEVINFIRRQKLSEELISNLKRKLLVVYKAVNDAEKQFSDPLVREWLVQVKDSVYDGEDLLDEIGTDALQCEMEAADSQSSGTHQAWNWKKVSDWVKAPLANQSMESRVKDMMAKLESIAEEKDKLGLKEGEGEKLSPRSSSTSLVDESFVYGRDEIKEDMVKWLLSGKENETGNTIDVMSIVGMGGSGKTTLAQLLFNHDRGKEHFHLKAWVCVSTEFLLIKVTKTILEEIRSAPTSADNLNLLQLQLKASLGNKKFLLVLDDVWDMRQDDWDGLRAPLLAAAPGSKIVVTSRSGTVAKIMRAVRTHPLGELNPEDSWSLFTGLAFPNGDSTAYPQLQPIGRMIVKKCGGLPLAIKVLGTLLHSKTERREWEDILNSETWHSHTDHEILPSLKLSYRHLSLPLKLCFSYCSIFPKDHEFDKEKLILLWMAEGLLYGRQSYDRMEEVGESYFDELLAKSFFQKSIAKESFFEMHDLMHDLAQHTFGEFCVPWKDDKVQQISKRARHFWYFNYSLAVSENIEAITKAEHLRTFLQVKSNSFKNFSSLLSTRLLPGLPKIRRLRVLSLWGYKITDLPDSIGNLKHLRYLDLSHTMIKKLPESICYLYNLQSMILEGCRNLTELPSRMGKLINLRYLNILGVDLREMPSDIGQFKSLRRLTTFMVGQRGGFGIEELRKLSEVRGTLHISRMENVVCVYDALRANMEDKSYLDELILDWDNRIIYGVTQSGATDDILSKLQPHPNLKRLSIMNYPGQKFPNWLVDPSVLNLVFLKLLGCHNCSTLPSLGQLPHLKHLQISAMNGVKCVGSDFYHKNASSSLKTSFPSLQTLSFSSMLYWEKWLCCGGRRGEFPCLRKLSIQRCPKLIGKLPKQLRSLKELEIVGCPQLEMASLRVPTIHELKMLDFGKLLLKRPASGFPALQTSTIEISDMSQWKQLPVVPQELSIRKCDSVESLLEEEILDTNIRNLKILDCCFSRSLDKVGLPSTLKSLSISKCTKLDLLLPELFRCHHPILESLLIDDGVTGNSLKLSFPLGIFPRLTDFKIIHLKGLESLSIWILEGDHTSLRDLGIKRCPNLEYIELSNLNFEYCGISNCSNLRFLAHTRSSLHRVSLDSCPELLFQIEGLPSTLRQLELWHGNQHMSQEDWGLQRLTSLAGLRIRGENMEVFPKECVLPSSLTSLQMECLLNLKSLDGKGLQQLTSLVELMIGDCPKLQSLRESGLQHLASLETLQIWDCPKLQYLTKERLPGSLSCLNVHKCPILEERCQFEIGPEWCYIAHIPKIVINDVLY